MKKEFCTTRIETRRIQEFEIRAEIARVNGSVVDYQEGKLKAVVARGVPLDPAPGDHRPVEPISDESAFQSWPGHRATAGRGKMMCFVSGPGG